MIPLIEVKTKQTKPMQHKQNIRKKIDVYRSQKKGYFCEYRIERCIPRSYQVLEIYFFLFIYFLIKFMGVTLVTKIT